MNLLKRLVRVLFLKPARSDDFMGKLTVARQLHGLCADCIETQALVKQVMVSVIEHTHEGHEHA